MSKSGKFAFGALLATATGYVAGILTAPKSGKETRADIKNAATSGMAEAEKQLKKLHTELNALISQADGKAEELKGKAKKEVEDLVATGKVVKEKARELLSALHEGSADDKDLRKAIDEATKAIEHLKSFLAKQA